MSFPESPVLAPLSPSSPAPFNTSPSLKSGTLPSPKITTSIGAPVLQSTSSISLLSLAFQSATLEDPSSDLSPTSSISSASSSKVPTARRKTSSATPGSFINQAQHQRLSQYQHQRRTSSGYISLSNSPKMVPGSPQLRPISPGSSPSKLLLGSQTTTITATTTTTTAGSTTLNTTVATTGTSRAVISPPLRQMAAFSIQIPDSNLEKSHQSTPLDSPVLNPVGTPVGYPPVTPMALDKEPEDYLSQH